ncbi:MAG TPA: hypothetical protein VLM40_18655 [Gemmata sp.]|nr:hypothetical protein [Gemmata sp.]
MLTSPAAVADLKGEWAGVIRMVDHCKRMVISAFVFGAPGTGIRNFVFNLPVLLAFDVLRQALIAARDQGSFSCKSGNLGPLLSSAKSSLTWTDWQALKEGVDRRNKIAHDGEIFDQKQCLTDVANIETQLTAWSII